MVTKKGSKKNITSAMKELEDALLNSKTKRPVRCPHFLYSVFEEGFNK